MKLVIGDYNYSSWSMRGWLAMRASGLPFDTLVVPLRETDTASRIAAHSPSGRVPCLIDDGLAVWDSLAIAEYLAERCPGLWPADPKARAVARAVSAEMHAGFTALRTHMSMNIRKSYPGVGRTPEVLADIARIVALWEDCRTRFGQGGPYLFGNWSIADMMYAPVCMRFATYAVELTGEAAAYMARVLAHPDVAAWVAAARAETHVIPAYDMYD